MTMTLTKFEAVKQALAEACSIDEVKEVRDKAEALRLYVKQQGDGSPAPRPRSVARGA